MRLVAILFALLFGAVDAQAGFRDRIAARRAARAGCAAQAASACGSAALASPCGSAAVTVPSQPPPATIQFGGETYQLVPRK